MLILSPSSLARTSACSRGMVIRGQIPDEREFVPQCGEGRLIRLEKPLLSGDQEASLTRLGIRYGRQDVFEPIQNLVRVSHPLPVVVERPDVAVRDTGIHGPPEPPAGPSRA